MRKIYKKTPAFHLSLPTVSIKKLSKKQFRMSLWFFATLASVLGLIAILNAITANKAKAAWFDEGFAYRQTVAVTNAGSAQTDFQIAITLDTATLISATKMQADCDDIRVTDYNGDVLPHWLEEGSAPCNNAATKIWVKVPSIPTSGVRLLLYYGNPTAASAENMDAVFAFSDDFNSATAQGKWVMNASTSFGSGAITITAGSIYTPNTILPDSRGYIYEYRPQWSSTAVAYAGMTINNTKAGSGNNSELDKVIMITTNNVVDIAQKGFAASGGSASYDLTSNLTLYTPSAATYGIDGFSMDSSEIKYWHNGSQTGTTVTGSWTAAPYMFLGYFNGAGDTSLTNITDITIDWVRVRKYATTEPTVGTPSSEEKSPGPVVYWKLNDAVGTTAQDASSSDEDLTLAASTATPTWQAPDRCIESSCLYFDGSNDYANSTSTVNLTNTSAITVSFWAKFTGYNDSNDIVMESSSSCSGTGCFLINADDNSGKFRVYLNGNTGANDVFFARPTADEWHQYTFVMDKGAAGADEIIPYVDGKRIAFEKNNSSNNSNAFADLTVYLMSRAGSSLFTQGFMDEVKIFPFAMTSAQAQANATRYSSESGSSATMGIDDNVSMMQGVKGYWNFDETSGNRADLSGNANTLTDNSSVGTSSGKFNLAGNFSSGSTDWLSITDQADLSGGGASQSFTVSAWVMMSSKAANSVIAGKYVTTGNQREYALWYNSSTDRFLFSASADGTSTLTNATADSLGSPSVFTWYFVTGWYDAQAGTLNIQVNDKQVDSTAYTGGIFDGTGAFSVGAYNGGSTYWNGLIDEVRVIRRALPPRDRTSLYNWAPGPVGYWKFDDHTGTSVADSSGNGQTGTFVNTPLWVQGKYGSALNFSPSSSAATVTSTNALNILNDITIEAWVRPNTIDSTARIFVGKGDQAATGSRQYAVRLNASNQWQGFLYSSGTTYSVTDPNTTPSTGRWDHITIVRQGTLLFIYTNGVRMGQSTSITGTLNSTANALAFGREGASAANFFGGNVDEVRIYNYARTPSQIVSDMNGGHPAGGSPVGSMLGNWHFDDGYGTVASNSGYIGSVANGTLTNMSSPATSTSGWQNSGKFNKALMFDGTDDVVNAGTDFRVDNLASMSASAWIYPETSGEGTFGRILDKGGWTWYMGGSTSELGFTATFASLEMGCYTNGANLQANTWQHVAVTYTNNTGNCDGLTMYVNGKRMRLTQTSVGTGLRTNDNTSNLLIGNTAAGDRTFDGMIDEVKVYNYPLTASEVAIDANYGSGVSVGVLGAIDSNISGTAPAAYWNFDEKNATTAYDKSGNSFIGTLTGGALWNAGRFGAGVQLDGTDDYITVADNSTLDFGSGSFTIGGWVRTADTDAFFIQKRVEASTLGYNIYLGNGLPRFQIGDGTNTVTNTPGGRNVADGTWHYITMVVNRTSNIGQIYIDGVQEGGDITISAVTGSLANTQALEIGRAANSTGYLNGAIDDMKMYSYVRTPIQIIDDYMKGAPSHWYKFDECSGGSVYNSAPSATGSGNFVTGSITIGGTGSNTTLGTCGSGTSTEAWNNGTTGKRNYALSFDGTDDVVQLSSTPQVNPLADFSIAAWIKPDAVSSRQQIYSQGNTGTTTQAFRFGITSGGYLEISIINDADVAVTLTSLTPVTAGAWQHVAVTKSANTLTLYVNGSASRANGVPNGVHTFNTSNIGALRRTTTTEWFDGLIDDVRIYRYQLTASQLNSIANSGAVYFGPVTGAP